MNSGYIDMLCMAMSCFLAGHLYCFQVSIRCRMDHGKLKFQLTGLDKQFYSVPEYSRYFIVCFQCDSCQNHKGI